jgi:tetratricopeptide (TPR) repeat protein
MPGYDAAREALVEREILGYAPDAVVFLSGQNEFFINRAPPIPLWRLKLQDFLEGFAWYRKLARGAGFNAPSLGDTGASGHAARQRDFERVYRENLARAREAGARVVACAPPLNYADDPPASPPPWNNRAFAKGWAARLKGDPRAALAAWRAAPADAAAAPFLHYLSGKALERLGRAAQARESLTKALDSEEGYKVCGPSCLSAIARVAREEEALPADADAAFRAFAAPGLPGLGMFGDEIHWAPRFHGLVTLAVVEAMRKDPKLGPWDERAWAELAKRWPAQMRRPTPEEARLEPRHILYSAVSAFATRGEFVWSSADWLAWLCGKDEPLCRNAEALELAFAEAQAQARGGVWAPEPLSPPSALLRWHLGAARLRLGKSAAAVPELAAAAETFPSALLDLAFAHALSGRPKEARQDLRQAALAGLAGPAASIADALGVPPPPADTAPLQDAAVTNDALRRRLEALGPDGAARWLSSELPKNAEHPGFLLGAAEAAAAQGLRPEAKRALSLAARLPLDEQQNDELARLWTLAGEPAEAVRVFERNSAGAPAPARQAAYAGALAAAGRREDALTALAKARASNPDSGAERAIARVYAELGDAASARSLYDQLIARDPADAGLKDERARLKR